MVLPPAPVWRLFPPAAHDETIGKTNKEAPATQPGLDVSYIPPVKHMVEEDITEDRRNHPALRSSLLRVYQGESLHYPRVEPRYTIAMPIRTVGEYLKRWGFTPKKPAKRALEQNQEHVERWLRTDYPKIVKKAKKEKAEIYWGDETGVQNDSNRVRGYGPKGKTLLLIQTSRKEHISMISAINNEGRIRFMVYREAMTSQKLITFMTRLIKDAGRNVYLILDNLKVHHSRNVTEWVEAHKDQIELVYLPPYSPELNPDEYLNGDLKNRVHSGIPARTEKDLKHKTQCFMRMLVKRPHRVRSYFTHPKVA